MQGGLCNTDYEAIKSFITKKTCDLVYEESVPTNKEFKCRCKNLDTKNTCDVIYKDIVPQQLNRFLHFRKINP